MKGGSYLLDSGIVIDLFKNKKDTVQKIKQAEEIYVSVIGLGELYYGANKSTKPEKHFLEVENLQKEIPILDCTPNTAEVYGRIKNGSLTNFAKCVFTALAAWAGGGLKGQT